MTITETGHRATQYKKIIITLPILCVDKNYRCIEDVFHIWMNLDKANFTPPYPDTGQWSNTYNIEIKIVDPLGTPDLGTGKHPPTIVVRTRTYVLTQIFRNGYYQILSKNPKSSHKYILCLFLTKKL